MLTMAVVSAILEGLAPTDSFTVRDGFAGITIQFSGSANRNAMLNALINSGFVIRQITPDSYGVSHRSN